MILPIDESGASAGFGDPDAQVTGDSECFTVVFRGNLRKLAGNPHRYVTPFGKVLSIGMGNAFETDAPTSELHTQAGIDQAVAVERERCARIAEGSARRFDFQKALAEQDDLEYGRNGARLDIARAIREGFAAPAPQDHVAGDDWKKIVSDTIGFGFEPNELQSINADDLGRLVAALASASQVPSGWKLVPKDPTPRQMEQAAFNLSGDFGHDFTLENKAFALSAYAELVAAAPAPEGQP